MLMQVADSAHTLLYNTIQYNTIQYNTIQLYCPRGEIRPAAKEHHKHNDITALHIMLLRTIEFFK